ncbi:hypothetical protein [Halalkalicoccus subterraneus]|uniref:hypothetical protein n=1 Tax=Halalkalicoccus subterraneus TaxID=2675002 RepID=UPI000EFBE15C|nr:hypothetical protein [Halalkalicoccus subterraneus]
MSSDDRRDRVDETQTWPELAIGLYDRLTGRGAEITYEFEDMEIDVPNKTGEDADYAHWRVDGTLRIATRERD